MRQRAIIGALLFIGVGVALGATVFRADIAQATGLAQAVTVDNAPANAVPVREQNRDGNGNVKVHEQGTANVNVTNSALSVTAPPVSDGGGLLRLVGNGETNFSFGTMASALTIHLSDGVFLMTLRYCSQLPCGSGGQDATVVAFDGPNAFGRANYDLALTRPIRFNNMRCLAFSSSDTCSMGWVGNEP
jgi:hypothetical protein